VAKRITLFDPQQITDVPTQGAESNLSGKFLERCIQNEFEDRGVSVYQYATRGDNPDLFEERFLLKHVPYKSIYGCRSHSEFVFYHNSANVFVRIECRWQQMPGSVDEKMPYLLMNARDAMPEPEIWLVVDGGGAREHALYWLRSNVRKVESKSIYVYDIISARKMIKALLNGKRVNGQQKRMDVGTLFAAYGKVPP
jgi:hypothetical protein